MAISLNFRESLFYAMLASVIGMVTVVLAAGFWFVLPAGPAAQTTLQIGNRTDFPPAELPYKAAIWSENDDHLYHFWVVNIDGVLMVYDARNPGRLDRPDFWRCTIAWEGVNSRFVDPCSGDKFALTGEPLAGRAAGSADWENYSDRGLDPIEFGVSAQGEIVIDLASLPE